MPSTVKVANGTTSSPIAVAMRSGATEKLVTLVRARATICQVRYLLLPACLGGRSKGTVVCRNPVHATSARTKRLRSGQLRNASTAARFIKRKFPVSAGRFHPTRTVMMR